MPHPPLRYGQYYHIYNRGINGGDLFRDTSNYEHFLKLYEKYIPFVADTYAWCLMKNHFHMLVRIKEEKRTGYWIPDKTKSGERWKVIPSEYLSSFTEHSVKPKKITPARQFAHLFNAYTKYFNWKYNRTGSLFEKNFRRIEITHENYLKFLVYYIHHNPVHHGFVEEMVEYPWSSYLTVLSPKNTRLKREEVIDWFDNKENFKTFHARQHELGQIQEFI